LVIKKLSGEKQLLIVFCKINKINENESVIVSLRDW